MPPCPAPHIIDRLNEMGLVEVAGMGTAALSWREIMAWQDATGIRLPGWEARLMRRLSVAYVTESRAAEEESCPPPFYARPSAASLERSRQGLRDLLRSARRKTSD